MLDRGDAAPLRHRKDVVPPDLRGKEREVSIELPGRHELGGGGGHDPAVVADRQKDAELQIVSLGVRHTSLRLKRLGRPPQLPALRGPRPWCGPGPGGETRWT